jgi:hypothetical protein
MPNTSFGQKGDLELFTLFIADKLVGWKIRNFLNKNHFGFRA